MARILILTLLSAALLWGGYSLGYKEGIRLCPDATAYEKERDLKLDREIEKLMEEPVGRDLVCNKIFDMVSDELNEEIRGEQEDISQSPWQ